MTIDGDFINEIKELAETGVTPDKLLGGDADPTLLGHYDFNSGARKYTLTSLEPYLDNPLRKRGQVFVQDVESFASYVNKHKGDGSSVDIFVDGDGAVAYLNAHSGDTPGWGDHKATLAMKVTGPWADWVQLAEGGYWEQDDFADFLERHITDIATPDAGVVLDLARDLKVHVDANFERIIRSGDGTVQFQYTDERTTVTPRGTIDLKEGMALGLLVAAYEGSPKVNLEGTIRYKLRDGALSFAVVFGAQVRDRLEEAREERRAMIASLTSLPVMRGRAGA